MTAGPFGRGTGATPIAASPGVTVNFSPRRTVKAGGFGRRYPGQSPFETCLPLWSVNV